MSHTTDNPITRDSGSGCGCNGSTVAAGSAGEYCGECETHGPVRPRFFAGQLLTEEDLELLSSYLADKNRLHNRYLHGAGVVCGLEVRCHPCDGDKIVVSPGYALDCCGNDIAVPCSHELDINAMVHRLRIDRLGGADCGDPCKDNNSSDGSTEQADPEHRRRTYCLWLRYCEQETDPVTPYATDECASQVCEPSRVREGYRFELRCPESSPSPPSILDRLIACFGDLGRADKTLDDANAYHYYGQNLRYGLARAGKPVEFGDSDIKIIGRGTETLNTFEETFGLDQQTVPDEALLREVLDALLSVGAAVTRFHLWCYQESAGRKKSMEKIDQSNEMVANAIEALPGWVSAVEGHKAVLSSPRDQIMAETVFMATSMWNDQSIADQQAPLDAWLYAYGAPRSDQLTGLFSKELARIREWLLNRIEGGAAGDCHLRRQVQSISSAGDDLAALGKAYQKLLGALLRYLIDCFCAALNPPCPPCDDAAVLLACITVEECEVVEICSLERSYVLSAPAMRYWLPPLSWLGTAFEWLCCELRGWIPKLLAFSDGQRYGQQRDRKQKLGYSYFSQTMRPQESLEIPVAVNAILARLAIPPRQLRAMINIGGNLVSTLQSLQPEQALMLPGLVKPASPDEKTPWAGIWGADQPRRTEIEEIAERKLATVLTEVNLRIDKLTEDNKKLAAALKKAQKGGKTS